MKTKEVKTSIGVFILKEPLAGPRNRAMIKAETRDGFKTSVFIFELLPKCIMKRPAEIDQDTPIDQVLDSITTGDYDALADALSDLMGDMKEESTQEKFEEKKT